MRARGSWPLIAVVVVIVVAACHDGDGVAIERWHLDGTIAIAPAQVEVPGYLPVRDRPGTYTLTAEVEVPEAWRGRALTLWIADVQATVEVRVDGVATAGAEAGARDGYRSRGPLSWPVPPEATRDGAVELAIVVDHRWTQSGWWSTAPRLVPAGQRPASSTWVLWINTYLAIAAAISLIQLGLTSLAIFLVDRSRRAYLWFAIQLMSAAYYPMHVLGLTQAWFGVYDTPMLAATMVTAIAASVWFTHVFFELGPPSRRWTWLWAGSMGVFAAFAAPFAATGRSGPVAVAVIAVLTCYQLYVCGRLAMRHPDRLTARFQLASWLALAVMLPADLLHFLGIVTVLDGARPALIGLLSFGVCLSLLLSRRHILSLRAETDQRQSIDVQRAELVRLNDELRRQVQERSSQLFAALALAGGASRSGLELGPGDLVANRYRVVRALGRGGMGTVHEVERIADGKRFALKLTHEVHGAALARLAREGVIASRVSHPNLVSVIDVAVSEGGFLFLVMELVDGAPLSSERDRWGDPGWALPLLAEIADGLVALHAAGVVHRDLKPANILIVRHHGRASIKIADFGVSRPTAGFGAEEGSDERRGASPPPPEVRVVPPLAPERTGVIGEAASWSTASEVGGDDQGTATRSIGEATAARLGAVAMDARLFDLDRPVELPESSPRSPALDGVVTRTGLMVGTPPYIPPEMLDPEYTPQPSADLFAFGVIAFELCTRERPFARPVVIARLAGAMLAPAPSLASRCPAAPPALVALVDRCLSIDADHRPTAAEVATGLRALLDGGAHA